MHIYVILLWLLGTGSYGLVSVSGFSIRSRGSDSVSGSVLVRGSGSKSGVHSWVVHTSPASCP